jgi:cysteine desulfurase
VDGCGVVAPDDLAAALGQPTALVSVMLANNEVGTLNPPGALAAVAHDHGALFHTDAVQAAGQLPIDFAASGVDLLSISAHKFYGPKGVGALVVRRGTPLDAAQSGGGHEEGRRSGTLNVPGIVGMARALELAYAELAERTAHLQTLRDQLIHGVLMHIDRARLTGHPTQRLPGHASFVIDGVDSNLLIMHLDLKGVAASSASACKTGNPEPSGVLLALGYPPELASGSLRLSVGKDTTAEDINYAVAMLAETVTALARLSKWA